jgi:hypothetical protein
MADTYIHSDTNHGTYVNPTGREGYPSPVTRPDGNENLDESYRRMNNKDFRPDFSNLENTYMFSYGTHKARENFWGEYVKNGRKYKNNNNSIDDPIFTGFTLSIDKLNSPLFYTIGQYDGVAEGRRRDDGPMASRNIADEIENCLRVNYSKYIRGAVNTYDINALLSKDTYPFPMGEEIGYGMQHNVYVDGLPYGATEYIYMVDKLLKDKTPQDLGGGHYSLGDGMANVSSMSVVDKKKKNQLEQDQEKQSAIKAENERIANDPSVKNETERRKENKKKADKEFQEADNEVEQINNKIKSLELVKSYENGKIFEEAVRNQIRDYMIMMENAITDLKPDDDASYHSYDEYDRIVQKMYDLKEKIYNTAAKYHGNPSAVQKLTNVDENYIKVTSVSIKPGGDNSAADGYEKLYTGEGNQPYNAKKAYEDCKPYTSADIEIRTETNISALERNIEKERENLREAERKREEARKKQEEADEALASDPGIQAQINLNDAINELNDIEQTLELIRTDEELKDTGIEVAPDATMFGDTQNTIQDDFTQQNSNKSALPKAPQTVYDMLGFINGMTKLTTQYPYLLQTITGLDEVYKNNYVVKDSIRGSGDERKITINIYESIDLKISSMFNKYFNAVYDAQYRRERVPVNLRRFNCSVFVHDIRNFHLMMTDLGEQMRTMASEVVFPKIVEVALNSMSAIEFKFYGCEIVPEETGSIFENVTNAEIGEMRMTNFTFTYSDCVINFLPFDEMKRNIINDSKTFHNPGVEAGKKIIDDDNEYKKATSEDFDRIFTHLKTSILASTGKNVFDDKKSIKEMKSILFPGNDVPTTKEIENIYPETETPDKVNYIDDIMPDDQISPVVGYLGDVLPPDYPMPPVMYLGDVLPPDYPMPPVMYLGDVLPPDRTSPVIRDLGDVLPNTPQRPPITDLGDVLPDDVTDPVVEDIGNVYPPTDTPDNVEDLGDVLPDDITEPKVNEIGNVYPDIDTPDNVEDLGDVLPDDITEPKVDEIGNVYPNVDALPNVENLGDVLPDDITEPKVDEIGNVYPNVDALPNVENLGDVLPDDVTKPIVGDIGNVYPNMNTSDNAEYIDNIQPDDEKKKIVTELENIYPKEKSPVKYTKQIENIYPKPTDDKITEELGNVSTDEKKVKNIDEIENIYSKSEKKKEYVEKLGNIYRKNTENEKVSEIGNVSNNDTPSDYITKIGNIYPKVKSNSETEDLGNVYKNKQQKKPSTILGDESIQVNIYGDENKKTKEKYVEDLGNVYKGEQQEKFSTILGDESIQVNIYGDENKKTKEKYVEDLNKVDVNEITSNILEKLDKLSGKRKTEKMVTNLGNVNDNEKKGSE